jgi:hypothetical protein
MLPTDVVLIVSCDCQPLLPDCVLPPSRSGGLFAPDGGKVKRPMVFAPLLGGGALVVLGWLWALLAHERHMACDEYFSDAVSGGGAEAAAMKCITDALFAQHFGWTVAAAGALLIVMAIAALLAGRVRGER